MPHVIQQGKSDVINVTTFPKPSSYGSKSAVGCNSMPQVIEQGKSDVIDVTTFPKPRY